MNAKYKNAWARKKRKRLFDAGICTKCGKRWAEAGRAWCKPCNDEVTDEEKALHAQRNRERRARNRVNGLCVDCGRKVDDATKYIHCKACRKRRAECEQVRRIKARIHKGGG